MFAFRRKSEIFLLCFCNKSSFKAYITAEDQNESEDTEMKNSEPMEKRSVTDEELEKVSGGKFVPNRLCPCGEVMSFDGEKYICPVCGHVEY